MPERALSDEEVAKLGLDQPAKERELSDAEVKSLGLDSKRVPSPTGWRDADKPEMPWEPNRWMADRGKENEAMWSWLASAAHGPAMAMEGPVAGLGAALKQDASNIINGESPFNPKVSPRDAYIKERDRVTGEEKKNLDRFPLAPVVGSVLTSPGSAPTVLGRLGMGMGQGGLYALGSSDADLTKGEFSEAGKDVGKGALIGGGGALAGELLQLPGRWLAGRAQNISDATHAAELAAEQEARAGAVASEAGKKGNLTAGGKRIWKELEDAMFNNAADEEKKAAARAFINSPEGKALYNEVLGNYIEDAPGQMGRIAASKEALAAAQAANDPALIKQAAAAAAEAKLNDPSGVTSRLAELARRNAPAAIGTALGGPGGAIAGALYSGIAGKQGRIMSNMMSSPSMYGPLTKGAALGIGAGDTMSKAATPLAEYFGLLDEEKK